MPYRDIIKDSTSQILKVFLRDSTTGLGKTGVAAASMSGDYVKDDNAADVALSFATGTVGDAYSSGKWAEIGNGYYFYHFPTASWTAYGETGFSFRASGAIDAAPKFRVVAFDTEDAVRAGLTSLPNATADAAGGLPISDAGGLDMDTLLGRITANVATSTALATAQADLDILTGTNGVTLATSQPNYAPATASAQLTMQGNITDILQDTATTIPALLPTNFAALGINASGHLSRVTLVDTATNNTDMRGTNGANTTAPDNASITAILADTNELQLNQDNWLTATGFSTHSASEVVTALGTGSTLTACLTATGFSTFNASTDTVNANLTQVLGTALSETSAGYLAAAFEFFFDVATPAKTINDCGVAGAGLSAEDVWTYATRVLTANTNLNDPAAADVAALILATPANLLLTDASGYVTSTNGGVSVLPATGTAAGRGEQTSLVAYIGETITQSITVYQSDGVTAYDLSGKTLVIVFETKGNVDVDAITDITISGDDDNVAMFNYTALITANVWDLKWTLREVAAPKTVILNGLLEVRRASVVDT